MINAFPHLKMSFIILSSGRVTDVWPLWLVPAKVFDSLAKKQVTYSCVAHWKCNLLPTKQDPLFMNFPKPMYYYAP